MFSDSQVMYLGQKSLGFSDELEKEREDTNKPDKITINLTDEGIKLTH